ncbi:MAG: Crp/Fnr family transcriptional regulator [Flavobacteriia bacterium]|nr:Crp/Fnr family transcriptional regulator [Flavobacteriia bacterium]
MQEIRNQFELFINGTISDSEWSHFSERLVREEFLKGEMVLENGDIENHLSFIESGVVRFYFPDEENDMTFAFAVANSFASAYDSFLTRNPSSYSIQALASTALWRIDYEDLQKVYELSNVGNKIGRLAAEDLYLKKFLRELSFMNDSATERYLALLKTQPELIQMVPLKYLASYIGVTPQALSRIRRRVVKVQK